MSMPIKDTPVLYGNDAKRFTEKVRENESRMASDEEVERALEIYYKVMRKNALFNE